MSNKNNGLGQARLKHAGASLNQNQDSVLRGAVASTGPTENLVRLDRTAHSELFQACEALTEKAPEFMQAKSWPADIVAQAEACLKSGSVH